MACQPKCTRGFMGCRALPAFEGRAEGGTLGIRLASYLYSGRIVGRQVMTDTVLKEIRRIKDAITRENRGDVRTILKRAAARQKTAGRRVIKLPSSSTKSR
jgi:hypothetical protein